MFNQNELHSGAIDPAIEPFLKRVLETSDFGLSRTAVTLISVSSSGKQTVDRFNLSVPYAGQRLNWTVMFNSSCPDIGPDFEFNNDLFMSDPDVETVETYIPSLANWDPKDQESLLKVLLELTVCYREHQIDLLNKQEQRLQLEYSMLLNDAQVSPEDVEMILLPDGVSPTEARFFIRLAIEFSCLPGRSNMADDDVAYLIIIFYQPNWNNIIPELCLSKSLEETFGGCSNLHIPPFQQERCVMDYIPEIKNIINKKVNSIVASYKARTSYIAAVVYLYRDSIIEYDAIDFSRITILHDVADFFFLVHFQLTPGFPKTAPSITLESIYHMNQKNELCKFVIPSYGYSPNWEPMAMVKEAMKNICQRSLEKFKSISFERPISRRS